FMIAKQTGLDPHFAAKALTAGILSNTILKMLIAIIIGVGKFRKITAIALGVMALVIGASLLLLR
ncbi:MAG TPA: hypothetical protein VFG11_05230, partial [Acidobacteriota bacterium]|nr:hypothetical protein [Acidobacteriota bacterium]